VVIEINNKVQRIQSAEMRLNLVREAVTGALFVAFASAYLVDPPTTASSDTIQDCSSWQVVVAGNTCASIADNWFITTLQFAAYVRAQRTRLSSSF
jgi:hypothetical protein